MWKVVPLLQVLFATSILAQVEGQIQTVPPVIPNEPTKPVQPRQAQQEEPAQLNQEPLSYYPPQGHYPQSGGFHPKGYNPPQQAPTTQGGRGPLAALGNLGKATTQLGRAFLNIAAIPYRMFSNVISAVQG